MKPNLLFILLILFCPLTGQAEDIYNFDITSYQFNSRATDSAAADLNGDNREDIIELTSNSLRILINSGSGFSLANSYITVDNKFKTFRTSDPNNFYFASNSFSAQDITVGDMNGDNIEDIVVANFGEPSSLNQHNVPGTRYGVPGGVAVLVGGGDGTFSLTQSLQFNNVDENPHKIELDDIDNDGDLDVLAILTSASKLIVYKNNGVGVLSEFSRLSIGGAIDFVLLDTEIDGDMDLLVTYNREFRIYTNDGTGSYSLSRTYNDLSSPSIDNYNNIRFPEVIDINGDGYTDVVTAMIVLEPTEPSEVEGYYPGMLTTKILYLINDGTGGFYLEFSEEFFPLSVLGEIRTEDVNLDGNRDFIVTGLNSLGNVGADVILFSGNGENSDFTPNKIAEKFVPVRGGYFIEGDFGHFDDNDYLDFYYFTNVGDLNRFIQNPITNTAPTLAPINSQTTTEGSELTFTLSATDADNNSITYSATSLPNGAALDPQTGLFTWTPDYNDAGTYEVTFTATEDTPEALSDLETVTISVINFNRPPVLATIGNQTINEGDTLTFNVSATDADGDNIVISASNLPAGATFNGTTFSWNTTYTDAGNYENIEFTATDNGTPIELDVELITITVGDVNRAPILTNPGPQEVLEEDTVSFTISASDPDNDNVTLTASNLPVGASFNGTIFSWTSGLSDAGVYTVTINATDTGTPPESASTDVVITVGDNPTPVEQAQDLVELVVTIDIPQNVENSYLANLRKVEQFILEGKITAALNQLNAFKNKVQQDYQQGILTQTEYQHLIDAANDLIADLQG